MSKLTEPVSEARHAGGIKPPPKAGDIPEVLREMDAKLYFDKVVGWGDCDPAQIAYTANIPAWGLLAIEEWYRRCIGYDWYGLNLELGIGTPFVSLNFAFSAPVKPGHSLSISILVSRLGNSSITHKVLGSQDGAPRFSGETVAAFVNAATMKPMPVPPNIRQSIQHYISVQDNEFTGR